ncbi:MAG: pantetheine-phosphate adenylyltransferase [Planctomycetaceae bacterium]|jgi:pantetheine-phosphate adenylyltransferase
MKGELDSRHAVYVGSFDPLTLGHEDIIRRGAAIFDRVTVGIGTNPDKSPLFLPEERLAMITEILKPYANVAVKCFDGLTVSFVRECGGRVMLRGIRTLSDIEAEFTMSLTNRALDPDIETVFLMASERYTHISSTLIKQIAKLGKDAATEQLKDFVPQAIIEPLLKKYRDENR